jgi:hypothetical protein
MINYSEILGPIIHFAHNNRDVDAVVNNMGSLMNGTNTSIHFNLSD